MLLSSDSEIDGKDGAKRYDYDKVFISRYHVEIISINSLFLDSD